jgi:hypothetical protein
MHNSDRKKRGTKFLDTEEADRQGDKGGYDTENIGELVVASVLKYPQLSRLFVRADPCQRLSCHKVIFVRLHHG